MPKKYPVRDDNHNSAELSARYFNYHLPINWTSHPPQADYGIDLIVDIFEGRQATGLELLVQLKSAKKGNQREVETVILKTKTYNLLWDKLQVVLLVKYVIDENRAYWILLKDVPEPNQNNDAFTVHIPKTNVFNNESWEYIKAHVREVTDHKLAARRVARLQQVD